MLTDFLSLQLFAEGAADGGETGGVRASGLTGDFQADFDRYVRGKSAAPQAPAAEKQDEGGEEEPVNVTGEAGEAEASEKEETTDPEAEFEELIKGKFKDQFAKRTQGIINDRFKNSKITEKNLSDQTEAIAPLFSRYNLEEGDIAGLAEAIRNDNTMFSRQAMAAGQTAEAFRDEFYAGRQKAAAPEEQQAELDDARAEMAATRDRWLAEEAEIRKTFPSFDLRNEIRNNPEFREAIENGCSVAIAYKGTRFSDLASEVAAAATQAAAKKTAETIAANASRPADGGRRAVGGYSPSGVDLNNLSPLQIKEYMDRAARGEKITFR